MSTKIEWCDETWNPVTGCTNVSPGCDHCYAKTMHERFNGPGSFDTVSLHPDRLDKPLRWRKPRKVFVNSMSDLFHEDVPDEYIARVWTVMALAPQHTFQILSKRHGRMRSLLNSLQFRVRADTLEYQAAHGEVEGIPDEKAHAAREARRQPDGSIPPRWPLPNVWLGVSVETQQWADIRIPALLETPAAVRFLSCEPLLSPVDLDPWLDVHPLRRLPLLDWVIVGGESGHAARAMRPDWAELLRDQCVAAGVPYLFKQWGGRTPKANGRILDGRTWDEYPTTTNGASA
jgi:protein gp37